MRSGYKIPWAIEPGESLRVPSHKQLRALITLANGILSGKVVRGEDGIFISDNNVLFSISDAVSGSSSSTSENWYPFKVYVFPSDQRSTPDAENDWRKFRVRSGVVFGALQDPVDVSGTDGATIPESFNMTEGDVTDIVVPDDTPAYWIWLDIDEGSTTAIIQHSTTRPAAWAINIIPVAVIDTSSYSDSKRALIRQYLRTDVIIPCLDFPA
jgi:hypothetical protein